jgi:hypothetical protein
LYEKKKIIKRITINQINGGGGGEFIGVSEKMSKLFLTLFLEDYFFSAGILPNDEFLCRQWHGANVLLHLGTQSNPPAVATTSPSAMPPPAPALPKPFPPVGLLAAPAPFAPMAPPEFWLNIR